MDALAPPSHPALKTAQVHRFLWACAAAMMAAMAALTLLSWHPPADPLLGMPPEVWTMVILMAAGAAWMGLPAAIRRSADDRATLLMVLSVGFAMRVVLFGSEPLFEIDFYRYLWDGAAVAAGLNPYAVSPEAVLLGEAPADWIALGAQAEGVIERINYAHLSTIYPPVAQAVFWLAHTVDPFGLTGLRVLLSLCELVAVGLLVLLLREAGRPPAWVAIYWWNPLIAEEQINSAHMDAILLPFVLGAILLAVRLRPIAASAALACAVAVKVWPVLLLPLVLARAGWRRWLGGAAVFGAITAALAVPVVLGRLDGGSGFVAYASVWERNDALFGLVRVTLAWVLDAISLHHLDPGRLTRLIVALLIGTVALVVAWRAERTAASLSAAALTVAALLFLLSPTGYPWYYVWMLPFLAIWPVRGLMLLTVLLPIYYLRFPMDHAGMAQIFDEWIVWIEFGPVLALLAYDFARHLRGQAA